MLLGVLLATTLSPIVGVGFGALVPNQTVAVTAALVWITTVEGLLVCYRPEFGRWLPGGASSCAHRNGDAERRAAADLGRGTPLRRLRARIRRRRQPARSQARHRMSRRHAEIEQLVARAARKHDTLAVGTFADGEATFHGLEAGEAPLFEIGSIGKSFTGVLLADMTLAGEVGLDDPVTTYFPTTLSRAGRNARQRSRSSPPTAPPSRTLRARSCARSSRSVSVSADKIPGPASTQPRTTSWCARPRPLHRPADASPTRASATAFSVTR